MKRVLQVLPALLMLSTQSAFAWQSVSGDVVLPPNSDTVEVETQHSGTGSQYTEFHLVGKPAKTLFDNIKGAAQSIEHGEDIVNVRDMKVTIRYADHMSCQKQVVIATGETVYECYFSFDKNGNLN